MIARAVDDRGLQGYEAAGSRASAISVSADRTVGFVGLGAMGAHMVARLIDAGHHVVVFDTRAEAMDPHVARGARACDSAG